MGTDSAAADVAVRAGVSNTNMCSSSSHQLEQLDSTSVVYAAASGHIRCSQWLGFYLAAVHAASAAAVHGSS
jgi:hypothetical protein